MTHDDPLIDPDCRDPFKHATCVGGPCECKCHDSAFLADYGRPTDEGAEPEETNCRTCGRVATEHTAGRFSIYAVCP